MIASKLHYSGDDYAGRDTRAACGIRTIYRQTACPRRVTCGQCKRTRKLMEMERDGPPASA